jgi:hypothetical protein
MKPIGLTLCVSVNISKGGPSQVVKLEGDGHDNDNGQKMMIKLQLGREEREKQKWAQGKGKMIGSFLFCHSRHLRGCEWI